jgi:hypothetical protein
MIEEKNTLDRISKKLKEKYLLEIVDKETRDSITKDFENELAKENYSKKIKVIVTCDENNNTAELIDEGKVAIRIHWNNTVISEVIEGNIIW